MAKRPYTRTLYDKLLAGFREAPGNASHAARVAGCDPRTARRAWTLGWAAQNGEVLPWARPIRDVVAKEADTAAARRGQEEAIRRERESRRLEAEDAEAEKAREERIETLKLEGNLLKAARQDVLSVLVVAAELVPAMRGLGAIIKGAVFDDEGKPRVPPQISPRDAMMLLSRHASLVGRGVYAAEAIIQLGRLDRGQPNAIVGVQDADMTDEQIAEEMEAAQGVLARLRKRGEEVDADDGAEEPRH